MYNSRVPTRLAAAILVKHGEISLGEIRALPLVEDEQYVLAIADLLAHNFPVIRFGRWEDGAPASRFEDVIRLVEDDEQLSAPPAAIGCTERTVGSGSMESKVRSAGVDEARTKLPGMRAANAEGAVTIVTKRGEPYAAVVPVSQALREAPSLSDLRGSANGCFGNAGALVGALRDEWR